MEIPADITDVFFHMKAQRSTDFVVSGFCCKVSLKELRGPRAHFQDSCVYFQDSLGSSTFFCLVGKSRLHGLYRQTHIIAALKATAQVLQSKAANNSRCVPTQQTFQSKSTK
eukprot:2171084-Amphidinium_carterae.1